MSPLERAARVVQRLAVLVSAGVPPTVAWGYLDQSDPVVAAAAGSADVPAAIRSASSAPAWRATAAAWRVATDAGAPLAPTLREFARSLRSLSAVEREVATALAGPAATTKLVMLLPVVAVLFGTVLGFDTLRVLFTTIPGWACLAVGLGLMGTAWWWSRRLLRSAQPKRVAAGLRCELVAVAVSGGGALDRATASVGRALAENGIDDADDAVADILALSQRAGVPAAELLRSEAEEQRREAAAEAQRAAAVLAVRLMLPLGLCILPAFLVLGVAPLLIAVVSSTVAVF